jgi:polyhydroxyalkanoate synthesis regulator phasin
MFETLDKLMLAGMGAISLTREKAEKIFDEAVKRGTVEKEQRRMYVDEMVENGAQARREFEKMVAAEVGKALREKSFATRQDVMRLETKVDQLLARA